MNIGKKYKTKQKDCVLECIKDKAEEYITIKQLANELKFRNEKVGLTTIYRNLEKLEAERKIAKVNIEGITGCCYRFLPQKKDYVLFYLKCEKCGKLINIECPELGHLYHHVLEEHHLEINYGKTMFYGLCENCRNRISK
ncbi:MAG: transcriptional repressor [Lachnospiraceae bacterium]|nr:transcriptional repressor [Lachnospiraceae bacterium]